jgi:predicted nucleotidyltransferase component of viral defense system
MAETKKINNEEFKAVISKQSFGEELLEKDYYVTIILYLLKDVEGIYFKGGTALQKIFLDYSRLSEDADYTLTRDVEDVKKDIISILLKSGYFQKVTKDKDVDLFVRLLAHYKTFDGRNDVVFIDLNKRAKLLQKPEEHKINHFYKGFIPDFSVKTLAIDEMIAEKMAATIGRNKPRDHFDMYKIIQKGLKINFEMVKQKCKKSKTEFDIIKMFNKAKKLNRRWDEDMTALIKDKITFEEVMTTLAKHFKLKEEKDKKKDRS